MQELFIRPAASKHHAYSLSKLHASRSASTVSTFKCWQGRLLMTTHCARSHAVLFRPCAQTVARSISHHGLGGLCPLGGALEEAEIIACSSATANWANWPTPSVLSNTSLGRERTTATGRISSMLAPAREHGWDGLVVSCQPTNEQCGLTTALLQRTARQVVFEGPAGQAYSRCDKSSS